MTPIHKVIASSGLLTGIAGIGLGGWYVLTRDVHTYKEIPPDYPTAAEPTAAPTPAQATSAEQYGPTAPTAPVAAAAMNALGKTGYKRIDAILPQLRASASSSGIPLGLMVGWIAKESGGNLASKTSLGEVGLFQSMPAEDATLGLDHDRVGTDLQYSIDAGVKLIRHYQAAASALSVSAAPPGSTYAWLLCKLGHCVGSGQAKKIVKGAQSAGKAGSWDDLEDYALGIHILGPQPKKWFPFLRLIYKIGQPFGFGNGPGPSLVGCSSNGSGLDFLGAEDA